MACERVAALGRAGEESLLLFYSLMVGLQGRRTWQGGWVRKLWAERELVLVESYEAELVVRRRWQVFHRDRLGFTPSWGTPMATTEVSRAGAPRFV
jgi:hypothetical protein